MLGNPIPNPNPHPKPIPNPSQVVLMVGNKSVEDILLKASLSLPLALALSLAPRSRTS